MWGFYFLVEKDFAWKKTTTYKYSSTKNLIVIKVKNHSRSIATHPNRKSLPNIHASSFNFMNATSTPTSITATTSNNRTSTSITVNMRQSKWSLVYWAPCKFFCDSYKFKKKKRKLLIFQGDTTRKIKFSIKYFFNKCDQIFRKPRIWWHLLKKSLMENFIFCAMQVECES